MSYKKIFIFILLFFVIYEIISYVKDEYYFYKAEKIKKEAHSLNYDTISYYDTNSIEKQVDSIWKVVENN